jgi:hypothetical protein
MQDMPMHQKLTIKIPFFTTVCKITHNQSIRHYKDGQLHRENGPAIEFANGSKEWYLNGKYHRTDGPAIENESGYKEWYLDGKKHGENNDFTNESWKHFQRTLIF